MSREKKLASLMSLMILGIAAVFIYLMSTLIGLLGAWSIVLVSILGVLVVFFFAGLALLGLILAVVALADCIQHYAVLREKREIERLMRMQQAPFRHHHLNGGTYSYKPRQSQTGRQPLDKMENNGC